MCSTKRHCAHCCDWAGICTRCCTEEQTGTLEDLQGGSGYNYVEDTGNVYRRNTCNYEHAVIRAHITLQCTYCRVL